VTLASYSRLVRTNRNFRLLWFAQIISEIGDWFYSVAIFSFLLEATGSAQAMALAFVFQVLPQVFTAPTAGVVNDRISRKRVMIFADWSRALIVASMLLVRGPQHLWLLYSLLFLETVMWALFEPGRTAVIPNITKGEETPVANALSSATWAVNFALGAGLGGLAAAYLGRPAVFAINTASFVVSALLIRRMQFEEPHAEGKPPLRFRDLLDFHDLAEGFRYVRESRPRLATMFVKTGTSLLGANWVILPIFGERIFPVQLPGAPASEAGTLGMSLLLCSRGAGAIIGSYSGAQFARLDNLRLRRVVLWGFLFGAIGYSGLRVAPQAALACLCVIIAHMGGSMAWTSSTTLLQQLTEDRFRGRVFSAEYALCMSVLSAVSYSAGIIVDQGVPVRTVAAGTGLLMLIPAVWWMLSQGAWRHSTTSASTSK
jgi:MFS family permease